MTLRVWHEGARVDDSDQCQCHRSPRKVVFARASVACREANSMARRERGGKRKEGKKKNPAEPKHRLRQQTTARTKTVCGRRTNLVTRNTIYTAPTTTAPPSSAEPPENHSQPAHSAPTTRQDAPTPIAAARAATIGNPAGSIPCTQVQQRDRPKRT